MKVLNTHSEGVYRFDEFELDPLKRVLARNGEVVPLTPKRFDILLLLIRNHDRLIDKDELMKEVWPETIVEETNLTHNISVLRKALGEKAGEHKFIVTVPGQGYRFVARVSESGTAGTIVIERTRSHFVIEEEDEEDGVNDQVADLHQPPSSLNSSTTELRQQTKTLSAAFLAQGIFRRQAVAIGLLAGLMISVLLASAVYLYNNRQAVSVGPFQKLSVSRLTTASKATSAVISPDGEYLAFVLEDRQGQALWLRHLPTSSNACIVAATPIKYWGITFSPDGDYIYYCTFNSAKSGHNLYRTPILGGASVLLPVETTTPVSFSPDGKRFAYVLPQSAESQLLIASLDGSEIRVLARRKDPEFFLIYPAGPAWSPDGQMIACSYATAEAKSIKCRVAAFRVEDGAEVALSAKIWDNAGQVAWLADNSRMVIVASEEPGSPKQLWQLSLQNDAVQPLTSDLNDYRGVSLAADFASLVTVQQHIASSLWIAPVETPDAAEQIASETGEISHLDFASDGRIIYASNATGKFTLQAISTDGKQVKQIPVEGRFNLGFSVSGDSRHLVFTSDRGGSLSLWKFDFLSGEVSQLTRGEFDNRPQYSPDGKWVIYEQGFGDVKRTFWKASSEGGEPVQLTNFSAMRPALSPDGKRIAFFFLDKSRPHSPWCIGLISADGGTLVKKFDIAKTVTSRFVNWTPDGKAVAYINDIGGVSNIWTQPLDGGEAKQLTHYQAHRIGVFDWSPTGKLLVISRAVESSYVALITDEK
jgi:Tol biopolymer transport system component/DNA-binding winged helix-turn-helix (wHTH) protein